MAIRFKRRLTFPRKVTLVWQMTRDRTKNVTLVREDEQFYYVTTKHVKDYPLLKYRVKIEEETT